MWADLVEEYDGDAELIAYDREEPPGDEIARSFGIRYQPVFVVLDKHGEEIAREAGINSEERLREFVAEHVP